jgi:hypothetical protein
MIDEILVAKLRSHIDYKYAQSQINNLKKLVRLLKVEQEQMKHMPHSVLRLALKNALKEE